MNLLQPQRKNNGKFDRTFRRSSFSCTSQAHRNHAKKGGMVILTSHQEVPSTLLKKINLADYKYNS